MALSAAAILPASSNARSVSGAASFGSRGHRAGQRSPRRSQVLTPSERGRGPLRPGRHGSAMSDASAPHRPAGYESTATNPVRGAAAESPHMSGATMSDSSAGVHVSRASRQRAEASANGTWSVSVASFPGRVTASRSARSFREKCSAAIRRTRDTVRHDPPGISRCDAPRFSGHPLQVRTAQTQ